MPTFDTMNGTLMEVAGGASITEVTVLNGQRQSIFRAYTYQLMDRPNLTVLANTLVTRLLFSKTDCIGVEYERGGETLHAYANAEVIVSSGAIQTPKLLMQSGVGGRAELKEFDIRPTLQLWRVRKCFLPEGRRPRERLGASPPKPSSRAHAVRRRRILFVPIIVRIVRRRVSAFRIVPESTSVRRCRLAAESRNVFDIMETNE